VRPRCLVTAAEALAILATKAAGYVRMAELLAILYIRTAVVTEVLAGSFDAVMKTTALNIAEFLRRSVPLFVAILTVSGRRRSLGWTIGLRNR
jgi:hypothetical protein